MSKSKKSSTIYIAGPMTGLPEWNHPAFHAAAQSWRESGWHVYSPPESFGGDTSRPRKEYMRRAVSLLLRADAIYLLPGWERSKGARLGVQIADELGLEIYHHPDAEPLQ